jgi:predicted DNA-binding transcriptional regulator
MRTNVLLATLGILLLTVPAALALVASDTAPGRALRGGPRVIEPTPLREGDAFLYVGSEDGPGDPFPGEYHVGIRVEPRGSFVDRMGDAREGDAYVVTVQGGSGDLALRCVVHPGTLAPLREDVLAGGSVSSGSTGQSPASGALGESFSTYEATNVTTSFGPACPWVDHLVAPRVTEGDRVHLGVVRPEHRDGPAGGVLSTPARRVDFHGRPALLVEHDAAEVYAARDGGEGRARHGWLRTTFAEGLPGPVQSETRVETTLENGTVVVATLRTELTGFEPGAGPARLPALDAEPPAMRPVPSRAYEPRGFDSAALGLPFPYDEARDAVTRDSSLGLAAWLEAHPDAFLSWAQYDRDVRLRQLKDAQTDGGWLLGFTSGGETYAVGTVRAALPPGLAGTLTNPAPEVGSSFFWENWESGVVVLGLPVVTAFPAGVAEGTAHAQVLGRLGFPLPEVRRVVYWAMGQDGDLAAALELDTLASGTGDGRGLHARLDPLAGGAVSLGATERDTTREGGFPALAPAILPAPVPAARRAAAFSFAGASPGAGLVGLGAATGVLGLLLVLKALAPFYTRLVRSRVLDQPARARLYDHVLAKPGLRQSEAVALLGLGQGAARRHLGVLCRHGFLVETRMGGMVGYYAAGRLPPEAARHAVLLQGESARRVYELLRAEPGLSLREAGRRLGLSAPSVLRHRRRLEKAGLLRDPSTVARREA